MGSYVKCKENWSNHFSSLFCQPSQSSTNLPKVKISGKLNISTDPFNMRELRAVTDSIKNKTSPGLDNIPAILWKDESFHPYLLNLCNHVFTTLECPSSWRVSGIVPVPKKSDLFDPFYYRGISLTAIASNIYNKLILNRLVPSLDPILKRNQNGFRRGRSTFSQLSSLRRIIEEMRNANREMTLIFDDFKKAFDSVDRQAMFEIPHLYAIPQEMVNAIKVLYTDTKARVLTSDGETDTFDIMSGILQGDTLAPFLFIIVLGYMSQILTLRMILNHINKCDDI